MSVIWRLSVAIAYPALLGYLEYTPESTPKQFGYTPTASDTIRHK